MYLTFLAHLQCTYYLNSIKRDALLSLHFLKHCSNDKGPLAEWQIEDENLSDLTANPMLCPLYFVGLVSKTIKNEKANTFIQLEDSAMFAFPRS